MAGTVTWSLLRELAGFRAEKGCAISLYLNLDPSDVPTAGDAQTRMNAMLHAADRTDRTDLTHEQRVRPQGRLRADRAAGSTTTSTETAPRASPCSRPGSTTSGGRSRCRSRSGDSAKVGRDFYLAPLVPLVGRADGTIVAVVGREQGQLYRLRAGRLEEIAEHYDETARAARPGRLVAGALPAAHREARPRAPEGSGRGARPQPAPAARRRRSCSSARRRCARSSLDALSAEARDVARRLDAGTGARRPGRIPRRP